MKATVDAILEEALSLLEYIRDERNDYITMRRSVRVFLRRAKQKLEGTEKAPCLTCELREVEMHKMDVRCKKLEAQLGKARTTLQSLNAMGGLGFRAHDLIDAAMDYCTEDNCATCGTDDGQDCRECFQNDDPLKPILVDHWRPKGNKE